MERTAKWVCLVALVAIIGIVEVGSVRLSAVDDAPVDVQVWKQSDRGGFHTIARADGDVTNVAERKGDDKDDTEGTKEESGSTDEDDEGAASGSESADDGEGEGDDEKAADEDEDKKEDEDPKDDEKETAEENESKDESESGDDSINARGDETEDEKQAIADFSLKCRGCGDESVDDNWGEDISSLIFDKEELRGNWKTCTEDEGARDALNCYVEDIYTDKIVLEFLYGFSSAYVFDESTTVVAATGGSAEASLNSMFLDDDYNGYVNIDYNCKPKAEKDTSLITLKLLITEKFNLTVSWLKVCGGGENDKVVMQYMREDGTDREGEKVSFDAEPLVVTPSDVTTTIFLKLIPPARSQTYEAPQAVSSSSNVEASVRGVGDNGAEISDYGAQFNVNYVCHGDDSANITLTVGIPPWSPKIATWTKLCGATKAVGLDVGTSSEQQDVLSSGEVQDSFDLYSDAVDSGFDVDVNTHTQVFYLSNQRRKGAEPVNIHSVTLTVGDMNVVRAEQTWPGVYASSYLTKSESTVGIDEEKKLQIHFVCLKEGKTSVLVSLATFHHGNIEFGFIKACLTPTKIEESGFLTTSSSLFHLLLVLLAIAAVMAVFGVRKMRSSSLFRRSYAPVPIVHT